LTRASKRAIRTRPIEVLRVKRYFLHGAGEWINLFRKIGGASCIFLL
jgi:hypothetical protein